MAQDNSQSGLPGWWPGYRTVWRWHFFSGMFCLPFVIILSITGTIYLFKPQLDQYRDSVIDHRVTAGSPRPLHEQVGAALASEPGSLFDSLRLPPQELQTASGLAAARVNVQRDNAKLCIYVDPVSLQVLAKVDEQDTMAEIAKTVHGELLLGKRGSYLVELAACWTIVLVLTGAVLWWPRHSRWGAGVFYPRLFSRGHRWWRDLHSVTGVWASALILFLILTGLPWATFWGDYFKSIRRWTGTSVAKQDWSGGMESPASQTDEHAEHGSPTNTDEHAAHQHDVHSARVLPNDHGTPISKQNKPAMSRSGAPWQQPAVDPSLYELQELDQVVARASELSLAAPVLVRPTADTRHRWQIESTTPNRPLRATYQYDVTTQAMQLTSRFADRHWIDRLVAQGIALHEGQRFGWLNQLLALLATTALALLSLTGLVMWWRRGRLIPSRSNTSKQSFQWSSRRAWPLVAAILALGVALPLFGFSVLGMVTIDLVRQRLFR